MMFPSYRLYVLSLFIAQGVAISLCIGQWTHWSITDTISASRRGRQCVLRGTEHFLMLTALHSPGNVVPGFPVQGMKRLTVLLVCVISERAA